MTGSKISIIAACAWPVSIGLALMSSSSFGGTPTSAPSIAAYVGKYPFDKVAGVTFLENPIVKDAVNGATLSSSIRQTVLTVDVSSPIKRSGMLIIATGCEAYNCGSHNWSIVVLGPHGPGAVCYHDTDLTDNSARWFIHGFYHGKTAGGCSDDIPPGVIALMVGA